MRYAVTSTGFSLQDKVDMRFGRCEVLVFYDTQRGSIEFIPNRYKDMEEHVGPKVVDLLVEGGIKSVISGAFGANIKGLLDSRKIQMIIPGREEMTIEEVINLIKRE